MRPTVQLQKLITKHMAVPGHVKPECTKTNFVLSGLRAATSANTNGRQEILSDISDVLNCDPTELDFLFSELVSAFPSPQKPDFSVPDFRTRLLAAAE